MRNKLQSTSIHNFIPCSTIVLNFVQHREFVCDKMKLLNPHGEVEIFL